MSVRAFRRCVDRAACEIVGLDEAELWTRRKRQSHMITRGLVVYVVRKRFPLISLSDLADDVGMSVPTLEAAEDRIAKAAFANPAIRRALFDISRLVAVDARILLPEPVTAVPVASSRRERVPA